jgi:hypothetical protein
MEYMHSGTWIHLLLSLNVISPEPQLRNAANHFIELGWLLRFLVDWRWRKMTAMKIFRSDL